MAAQAMSYIACDVPEGMRLGAWRAAQTTRRSRRLRIRGPHRHSALRAQPQR